MNTVSYVADTLEVSTELSEVATLTFVEDSEFEFVGGGNAVNAY